MHVNAHLDLDFVAIEQADEVTLMLELDAPPAPDSGPRPPAAVQIVLDRSGSMGHGRLEAAKDAITALVDRLDPGDSLGVVAFDDDVQMVLPARTLSTPNRQAAKAAVARLVTGGMTNLSGGLLRGLQEARRAAADRQAGATLILLSDGRANQGETDPGVLARVAAGGRDQGITTSTVGIGLGYDELLLSEIAGGGQGNHVFAEQGDAAAAAVAGEVDGLLSKTVQAASLVVRPASTVESVTVWNDLPGNPVPGGIMVELGDLWASEQRKLVLTFKVPAMTALGLAEIARVELRYVAVPAFVEQTITVPVHVNVVPGDQAAGRIPDTKVRTELVYQQAQSDKRRAAEALREGDIDRAVISYEEARTRLAAQMEQSPDPELQEEIGVLGRLQHRARKEAMWSAKSARMDAHYKSRKRGRRRPEM